MAGAYHGVDSEEQEDEPGKPPHVTHAGWHCRGSVSPVKGFFASSSETFMRLQPGPACHCGHRCPLSWPVWPLLRC